MPEKRKEELIQDKFMKDHPMGQYVLLVAKESPHSDKIRFTDKCKITNHLLLDKSVTENLFKPDKIEVTCPYQTKHELPFYSAFDPNGNTISLQVRKKEKIDLNDLTLYFSLRNIGIDENNHEFLDVVFEEEFPDNKDISIEEEEAIFREYNKPHNLQNYLDMALDNFDLMNFSNDTLEKKWTDRFESELEPVFDARFKGIDRKGKFGFTKEYRNKKSPITTFYSYRFPLPKEKRHKNAS